VEVGRSPAGAGGNQESFDDLGGRAQAEGSVGAFFVVVMSPVFDDDAGLAEAPEQFAVEAFAAQLAVKALDEVVLPGAAWVDVAGLDLRLRQPPLDDSGDELRSVVAADKRRCAVFAEPFQRQSCALSRRPRKPTQYSDQPVALSGFIRQERLAKPHSPSPFDFQMKPIRKNLFSE